MILVIHTLPWFSDPEAPKSQHQLTAQSKEKAVEVFLRLSVTLKGYWNVRKVGTQLSACFSSLPLAIEGREPLIMSLA